MSLVVQVGSYEVFTFSGIILLLFWSSIICLLSGLAWFVCLSVCLSGFYMHLRADAARCALQQVVAVAAVGGALPPSSRSQYYA